MKRGCLVLLVAAFASCSQAKDSPPPESPEATTIALRVPSASVGAVTSAPSNDAANGPAGTSLLSAIGFKRAKVTSAKAGAEAVGMAVSLHFMDATGLCPTLQELVATKKLDPKGQTDPWGNPYRIICNGGEVRVISNGRDGVEGSADDVSDDATPADLERIGEL